MNAVAQFIFSVGFALLYLEMAIGLGVSDDAALPLVAGLGFIGYLAAFYLPQVMFRYSLRDDAPTVLAQLSRRFAVAAAITLGLNLAVAALLLPGKENAVPVVMEIYSAAALGLLIFHAMGGLMAEQANYLQRTNQYKSDQLLAVVVAMCILFVLLAMYFLAFDLAITRAPRIYVRDMMFGTLALMGFGWFLYRVGHH